MLILALIVNVLLTSALLLLHALNLALIHVINLVKRHVDYRQHVNGMLQLMHKILYARQKAATHQHLHRLVLTVLLTLIKPSVRPIQTRVHVHLLKISAFVLLDMEVLIQKPVLHAKTRNTKPPLVLLPALPVLRVATLLLLTEVITKSLTLLALTPNALLLAPAQQVH